MLNFESVTLKSSIMKLLSINATDGASLLINIEHISAIIYTDGSTKIQLSNGSEFFVKYSLPELIKEIEEAKPLF